MRVERREMAARARRDPSAERRELEGLREMAQRVAVRAQLVFERGTEYARLDSGRARSTVDFDHHVEIREVDRDAAAIIAICRRLDAADHARTAAVRRHCHPGAVAPFEDANHVLLVARKGDDVPWIRIMAAERAHDIAKAAPIRMAGAIVGAARANRCERIGRLDPRRTQMQFGLFRRRHKLEAGESETRRHPLGEPLLLVGIWSLILVAPAVEFASALRHCDRSLCFFLTCYANPPPLHSFPTRRSSESASL